MCSVDNEKLQDFIIMDVSEIISRKKPTRLGDIQKSDINVIIS